MHGGHAKQTGDSPEREVVRWPCGAGWDSLKMEVLREKLYVDLVGLKKTA